MLTHPAGELETSAATRRAVAYLSARLGERLAGGTLGALAQWNLASDTAISTHHLAGYLQAQQQAALQGVLHAPEMQAALGQLLGKGAQPT